MTTILEKVVDERILVVTGDGRIFVGNLRGFDQNTNLVLSDCQERVFSEEGSNTLQLGLYLIRGDLVCMVCEVDDSVEREIDLSGIRAAPLRPIHHSR